MAPSPDRPSPGGDDAAPGRTVETLDGPPTLGLLYGRALLTARSGGGSALPARTLELPAVRVGRSFRVPEDAVHEYLRGSYFDAG